MMTPTRRQLLTAAAALPLLGLPGVLRAAEPDLAGLADITADARPISRVERADRLARAQALMKANGIGSVLIEPGASMVYFTGVRWSRSERLACVILPDEGMPCIVLPFFEEAMVHESLDVPCEIRVWQEERDPLAIVAGLLKDRKLLGRPIAIEETMRYFAVDGLMRVLPDAKIVSANPVVRACRMIKSPAEIALMQKATDVTIAAYRWTYQRVEKGMTNRDVAALMNAATRKLGGDPEFELVLIGPAAANPHGSRKPQIVADGQVVLMDCGCTVEGYQSDVSRTFVPGTATAQQRKVWGHVARGQQVAYAAAKLGTPAGQVDDAVRAYYTGLGYGPNYRLPGLSHRTGHGIGLDGHEPVNLVRGEMTKLAPGMCFSDEPGLYLPEKFGIRLEDCFHMTDAGPVWFSKPPRSIDAPFG